KADGKPHPQRPFAEFARSGSGIAPSAQRRRFRRFGRGRGKMVDRDTIARIIPGSGTNTIAPGPDKPPLPRGTKLFSKIPDVLNRSIPGKPLVYRFPSRP